MFSTIPISRKYHDRALNFLQKKLTSATSPLLETIVKGVYCAYCFVPLRDIFITLSIDLMVASFIP